MAKYRIKLFISGETPTSTKAKEMMDSICTDHLEGDCDIEVIDILLDPEQAEEEGIMAIPTLIRKSPLPEIRLIGALTIKTRIVTGLGIIMEDDTNQ
jgi:circadian clock protein KaiB